MSRAWRRAAANGAPPARRTLLATTACIAAALCVAGPRAMAQSSDTGSGGDSGAGSSIFGGAPAPQAPSGSLLPLTGFNPASPGLTDQVNSFFGLDSHQTTGAASAGPPWQIKSQVTVSEEYTDNASAAGGVEIGGAGNAGSDFITKIQPQLQVVNTSDRAMVNLSYAPTLQVYAENSDYTQVREQGNGDVFGTIVPNLFYADLRGSITQQPIFGGFGPIGIDTLPPQQQETLSNVSATPYFSHAFGGTGTLQAGVSYIYTDNQAPDAFNQPGQVPLGTGIAYGNYWLATKRIFANFGTGEDFGRFQNVLSTDNSFYDGSTALRGSQRVLVTDDASYAINRFVSALGEIGYENLSYPNSGFAYVGGVWAAGVRLSPNDKSAITLEYRHIDGIDSPYIYGSWQALPRLRIFGSYSEGITSFEQDQQNSLLSSNSTQTGVAGSALFAAPVLNDANYFGGNQGLTQSRRLSASAIYTLDRDVLTASFDMQKSTQIGNAEGLPTSLLAAYGLTQPELTYFLINGIPSYISGNARNFLEEVLALEHLSSDATSNYVASLTWHHDLRPDLSTQLYLGYTRSLQAYTTNIEQSYALVSASVNYTFTKTLSGSLTYTGHYTVGGQTDGLYDNNDNTFTVSLTKSF